MHELLYKAPIPYLLELDANGFNYHVGSGRRHRPFRRGAGLETILENRRRAIKAEERGALGKVDLTFSVFAEGRVGAEEDRQQLTGPNSAA